MAENLPLRWEHLAPGEYDIEHLDDGRVVCRRRDQTVIIDDGGKAFHRNGIKFPAKTHTRWLIAELDGVRLYDVGGGKLVLTKKDLYP